MKHTLISRHCQVYLACFSKTALHRVVNTKVKLYRAIAQIVRERHTCAKLRSLTIKIHNIKCEEKATLQNEHKI